MDWFGDFEIGRDRQAMQSRWWWHTHEQILTLDSEACIIYASQSYKYEHEFVHTKYICSLCEYVTFELDCHLQTDCFTCSLPEKNVVCEECRLALSWN